MAKSSMQRRGHNQQNNIGHRIPSNPDLSSPSRCASDQDSVPRAPFHAAELQTEAPRSRSVNTRSTAPSQDHLASTGFASNRRPSKRSTAEPRNVLSAPEDRETYTVASSFASQPYLPSKLDPSAKIKPMSNEYPAGFHKSLLSMCSNAFSRGGSLYNGLLASLETCLGVLDRSTTISIDAANNLATSSFLGFIIACFVVLLICFVILTFVLVINRGARDGYAEAKLLAYNASLLSKTCALWSYKGVIFAKEIMVQTTSHSIGLLGAVMLTTKRTLCHHGYGATVKWLGYSCDPTVAGEHILDSLSVAAVGVGQWANASTLLLPYSDYFKTADLAVGQRQLAISLNPVDFPGKKEFDNIMTLYSEGLLNGGELLFDTVLDTEDILVLILHHFLEAERQMRRISSSSRLWSWYETREVDRMLQGLLERLDNRLYQLIKSVDTLREIYRLTATYGRDYAKAISAAQEHVNQQIHEKGTLFGYLPSAKPLYRMAELLVPFHFPIEEIAMQLGHARNALGEFRSQIRLARRDVNNMAYESRPKTTFLMLRLRYIIASTKANLQIERARENSRRQYEREQGLYTYPGGVMEGASAKAARRRSST